VRAVIAALLVIASACAKEVDDPIAPAIDFGDPKSVLGAVIFAARSGDPAPLSALCDPAGGSEPSVQRVCALEADSAEWASFRAAFGRARLNGEPRVSGDRAALNFVYGPDGTTSETMELVRKGGRWYLLRF
jgi:hypothetical protein